MKLLCIFGILWCLIYSACGHGRLLDPPGRSSAWRAGFNTPHNYDDNALFCGGFSTQQNNGGKCGICGDPWNGPRENEAGGKYATGKIVRNFTAGQVMPVRVEITANHFGWFEFRLCPNNDVTKPATQDCLDKNLLSLADGSGTRYKVDSSRTGYWNMKLKLPDSLTCSQCVLQWKYHCGNSWGVDRATGRGCVGCGPQEEFYGCADIQITSRRSNVVQPVILPQPTTIKVPPTTSTTTTTTPKPTTQRPATQRPATQKPATPKPTVRLPPAQQRPCVAINLWAGQPGMDAWCTRQCAKGNCPEVSCDCNPLTAPPTPAPTTTTTTPTTTTTTPTTTTTTTLTTTTTPTTTAAPPPTQRPAVQLSGLVVCKAINYWAGDPYLDKWCSDSCARGNCPESSCKCTRSATTTTTPPTTTTTPTTTRTTPTVVLTQKVCRAISVWKGIDVFDRWCTEECNKANCPANTCACVDTPLLPLNIRKTTTTMATTTTQATPRCSSNGVVAGTYWNTWCQTQCDRNYCPVEYCNC